MKTPAFVMLGLAMLLSACQTTSTPHDSAALLAGQPQQHHAQLKYTRWNLTQIGAQVVTFTPTEQHPFIQLSEDQHSNRLIGLGGCNRLMGSYVLENEQLTFAVASTKRFCADRQSLEQQFLEGLSLASRHRITGQTLHLLDASGAVLLQFSAAE